ncbi:hypothetical protein [Streptomyces sp. NPDC088847]|uniref:hypothetical protein n=1 Tax=Streptomyces sp. NPDC088847 TaxID=3365909 RepID=UPI00382B0083
MDADPGGLDATAVPERAVPKPSKYTLLLDQDCALTLDQLALTLRRRAGRPVDRSEILRELIRALDRRTTS